MARQARLIWTAPAVDDLDDVAAFIAAENPRAAAELVAAVFDAVERLRRFPDAGRYVPEIPGRLYRECIVPPLRVIYRRDGARIVIVYVVRGERPLRRSRLR